MSEYQEDEEHYYWRRVFKVEELESQVAELKAKLAEAEIALVAVDTYFTALTKAWFANDGRLVSESGSIIEGTENLDSLCDLAGIRTKFAIRALRESKP